MKEKTEVTVRRKTEIQALCAQVYNNKIMQRPSCTELLRMGIQNVHISHHLLRLFVLRRDGDVCDGKEASLELIQLPFAEWAVVVPDQIRFTRSVVAETVVPGSAHTLKPVSLSDSRFPTCSIRLPTEGMLRRVLVQCSF